MRAKVERFHLEPEDMSPVQLVAEVRHLRACRAIEQEALANALPILADAANVANAWNVAGRAPAHHRSMQAQLRKAWPTLARAVESLASR